MPNIYSQFKALLPDNPLLVGTVAFVGVGYVMVEYLDGTIETCRGTGSVGTKVFVRAGVVEGVAPVLPAITIEV